jgi:hypothetical protein
VGGWVGGGGWGGVPVQNTGAPWVCELDLYSAAAGGRPDARWEGPVARLRLAFTYILRTYAQMYTCWIHRLDYNAPDAWRGGPLAAALLAPGMAGGMCHGTMHLTYAWMYTCWIYRLDYSAPNSAWWGGPAAAPAPLTRPAGGATGSRPSKTCHGPAPAPCRPAGPACRPTTMMTSLHRVCT